MTQVTFKNGTQITCHHVTVESVPQRWRGTNKIIDICYIRLHFTIKISQLHIYSDIDTIKGINPPTL